MEKNDKWPRILIIVVIIFSTLTIALTLINPNKSITERIIPQILRPNLYPEKIPEIKSTVILKTNEKNNKNYALDLLKSWSKTINDYEKQIQDTVKLNENVVTNTSYCDKNKNKTQQIIMNWKKSPYEKIQITYELMRIKCNSNSWFPLGYVFKDEKSLQESKPYLKSLLSNLYMSNLMEGDPKVSMLGTNYEYRALYWYTYKNVLLLKPVTSNDTVNKHFDDLMNSFQKINEIKAKKYLLYEGTAEKILDNELEPFIFKDILEKYSTNGKERTLEIIDPKNETKKQISINFINQLDKLSKIVNQKPKYMTILTSMIEGPDLYLKISNLKSELYKIIIKDIQTKPKIEYKGKIQLPVNLNTLEWIKNKYSF